MYRTLFNLSTPAMVAWALLIFLPTWSLTRRLAESALAPVYLAGLYTVGLLSVIAESGPGFMSDFGSAEGVLRLLRMEPVALVAWIHILVFDQVIAHLIYRDNMTHRFVPIPVQSVILVLTLMLGPIGFLSYWIIRIGRTRRLLAWGSASPASDASAGGSSERERASEASVAGAPRALTEVRQVERSVQPPAGVKFYEVVTKRSVGSAVAELWRRERTLFDLGKLGLGLALVCAVIAALNGGWLILPEGRLLEAAKFDAAFGIYFLTLALIVPFAGMTARGRRRWLVWTMWIAIFSFALENIQTWRGLNPRFSRVAGPIDQALGGVFFLLALAVAVTFVILAARFFRSDTLADHPPLRVAFRYAAIASLVAFSIGVVMVSVQGRAVAGAGNLMPLHASGFHGLQAIPLVALLLGWSRMPTAGALRCVHAAGISWLVVCAGLLAQALAGIAPLTPTLPLAVSVIGAALWGAALAFAWRVSRDGDAMPMATS